MTPPAALILSIILILLLIRLKVNLSLSIFIGALTLGLLSIGTEVFYRVLVASTSIPTLKLLALVTAAFTLGYSMEHFKLLDDMTLAVSRMLGMLSVAVLPLLIGLLPMPGGALISAIMLKDLVKKYDLTPERSTFINYWFRHVWVAVWPLYPNIIIAAAVVEIDYARLVLATYPIALASLIAGMFTTRKLERRKNLNLKDAIILFRSLYPIIAVAVLALLFRVDLLLTILLMLLVLYLHKRAKPNDLAKILKRTADMKIVILIFAVMSYKDLVVYTNAAEIFFEQLHQLNFPPVIASFLLSFLVGFATGIELSYSSIALPLLTTFTGVAETLSAKNFMLVMVAGYLGVMLSPMHLCLALTTEYFKASLGRVYRVLLPSAALVFLVVFFFIV
jgi:hypothetical protein